MNIEVEVGDRSDVPSDPRPVVRAGLRLTVVGELLVEELVELVQATVVEGADVAAVVGLELGFGNGASPSWSGVDPLSVFAYSECLGCASAARTSDTDPSGYCLLLSVSYTIPGMVPLRERGRSMKGSKAWRINRRAWVLLMLLESCLADANF